MGERGYQYDFSLGKAAMHSAEGRRQKALTMLAVFNDVLGADRVAASRVLNVGCSTGFIDEVLAEQFRCVTGVDIDRAAIQAARQRCVATNLEFRVGDAMALDFPDESFDVVTCCQVYEHVPDPHRMMAEIHRVLAPGGVCYFAATNRLCVIEQHYFLPFLSYLPQWLANRYLRLLGKGSHYYERHLSYWGLCRLVRQFRIDDMTRSILEQPDRFEAGYLFARPAKRTLARTLARFAYWAFPGYVWLLWRLPGETPPDLR